MAKRKEFTVLVTLSVKAGITKAEAVRELRTRTNELCAYEYYDGAGSGENPSNVRVKRVGNAPRS